MYIDRNNFFVISFLGLCTAFFVILMIALEVNATDWFGYKNITINFSRPYFYQEYFSWWLIGSLRDLDERSYYISALIFFMLSWGAVYLLNSLSDGRNFRSLDYSVLFLLMFSNFFILLSVNGLRQGIALSLLMFSIGSRHKENLYFSYLFFVLSIFSHNSAILYLPLLINHKYLKYIFQFVALIGVFFVWGLVGKSTGITPNNNSLLFLLIALLLLFVLFQRKKWLSDGVFIVLVNLVLIVDQNTFERLMYYTIPLMLLYTVSSLKLKNYNFNFLLFIIVLMLDFLLWNTSSLKGVFDVI